MTDQIAPLVFNYYDRSNRSYSIKAARRMQGLSLKTQQLYAVVFLTRLMFKVVYEQVVLPEYLSRGRSRGWSRGWSRGVGG